MASPMLVTLYWDIYTSPDPMAGTDTKISCELLRDDRRVVNFILEPGDTTPR